MFEGWLGLQNFLSIFDSAAMFTDDVKNGSRYELEGLNEEMAKEYVETKKLISRTKGNFTKAVNRLNRQRLNISSTTLKSFVEYFSKLKHVEFDDIIVSIPEIDCNITEAELNQIGHQKSMADALMELHIGGVGAWFAREWKLLDEIEAAKHELGNLKVQCAEIRQQCARVSSATHFLETTYASVGTLQKITDGFNERLGEIIDSDGTDYAAYGKEIREQVRLIYRMNKALNFFVEENVITEKGYIRKTYKKYLSGISKVKDETVNYINSEDFYLGDNK